MPKPKYPAQLLVGLSEPMKAELQAIAERKGQTMSGLVRQLVAQYLERQKQGAAA